VKQELDGRRQLNRFLIHLGCYFAATVLSVFVNLWVMPRQLVVLWPLTLWGVILALHGARVMGLWPQGHPKQ
jgi:hypothetical protein